MNNKTILSLAFFFLLLSFTNAIELCLPDAPRRIDCGYYGIDQQECEGRGCCWTESQIEGTPWCYFQTYVGDTCDYSNAAVPSRIDCGYYGIDEDECEGRGCCWGELWEDSIEPWCFYKNSGEASCCPEEIREDCGYYGIDEPECLSRGCCWSPLDAYVDEPWCFFSNCPEETSTVQTSVNDTMIII